MIPPRPSPDAQLNSPSYVLAEEDTGFLARPELRPLRVHLELLKPEFLLREQGVKSTVVLFGSARIPAPEDAEEYVGQCVKLVEDEPDNPHHRRRLAGARRLVAHARYYEEARRLGALISSKCQTRDERHYVVVTGGGPGIMEAGNRGAQDAGCISVGLNITLPFEQAPNAYITPSLCFNFHYFAMRKMHFLLRARALICFPGGFGTLDELFDALTLIQTHKMEPIPVLLFGRPYWQRIVNFEAMVDEGTISPEDLELMEYVDTAEEAWQRIATFHGEVEPGIAS